MMPRRFSEGLRKVPSPDGKISATTGMEIHPTRDINPEETGETKPRALLSAAQHRYVNPKPYRDPSSQMCANAVRRVCAALCVCRDAWQPSKTASQGRSVLGGGSLHSNDSRTVADVAKPGQGDQTPTPTQTLNPEAHRATGTQKVCVLSSCTAESVHAMKDSPSVDP